MRAACLFSIASILAVPACTMNDMVRVDTPDPLFLEISKSPDLFDGKVVAIRAWITLRHEDNNLWATAEDHNNWRTVHCISLANYDFLDESLDGRYVEVVGVIRSDASKGGTLIRFASCREVAIELAGPNSINPITQQ